MGANVGCNSVEGAGEVLVLGGVYVDVAGAAAAGSVYVAWLTVPAEQLGHDDPLTTVAPHVAQLSKAGA